MSARPKLIAALTALTIVAVTAPAFADSRAPTAVMLSASATSITPGTAVTLTVTIDPPSAGEQVTILDGTGALIASGSTDVAGSYTTPFAPQATVTLHSSWQGLNSQPVTIMVAPHASSISVAIGPVRLFDDVKLTGRVAPYAPGIAVRVQLLLTGNVVATRTVTSSGGGRFSVSVLVAKPGTYRARATAAGVAATSPHRTTLLPDLAEGAHGVYVSLLERRLVALHYHLTGVDETYDFRTADAVMAFRKVQGLPRIQTVTTAVWRGLAAPKVFVPRTYVPGTHIEVNQSRQVLALVMDGKVAAIIHVSTGKPSTPTNDGTFHVYSKLAGYSSKGLYYPSFFDGERAIHGWPDVPTYAASHGCVRVPEWIATWIYGLDPIGTPVLIYH